jgi:hypothetical protein
MFHFLNRKEKSPLGQQILGHIVGDHNQIAAHRFFLRRKTAFSRKKWVQFNELTVGKKVVASQEDQGSDHEEQARDEEGGGEVGGGEEVEERPHGQQHQAGPVDCQDQHVGEQVRLVQCSHDEAEAPEREGHQNNPHHDEERFFVQHIPEKHSILSQPFGHADKARDIDDVFDQEGACS